MSEYLFGLACEKASNAFLFSAFYECAEGRRSPDDCVIIGAKRAREYVDRARKSCIGLTRIEDLHINTSELEAYLELSEALAENPQTPLPGINDFDAETSFLARVLEDIENKRALAGERKQKASALFLKLSIYFSKKFHEATKIRHEEDDD